MNNKKLPYGMKRDRVRALLSAYPDKSDKEIAREVGCHVSYVMNIRHKEYAQELEVLEAEGLVTPEPEAPVRAHDVQMGGDHYKTKAVQPWDVYDTWPTQQRVGAYRANCVKYAMRMDDKDTPLLNAQKLMHYAQKLVEVLIEIDQQRD